MDQGGDLLAGLWLIIPDGPFDFREVVPPRGGPGGPLASVAVARMASAEEEASEEEAEGDEYDEEEDADGEEPDFGPDEAPHELVATSDEEQADPGGDAFWGDGFDSDFEEQV